MAFLKKRIVRIILMLLIAMSVLFASAWFYASYRLSHLETFTESIKNITAEKINRDVTFETGKARLSLRDGLNLEFTHLAITEKDRSSTFMNVKKAFFRVQVLPLFTNKVVFTDAVLEEPRLFLKRDRQGVFNIADLLEEKKKKTGIKFRKMNIHKGWVNFFDQDVNEEGLSTSLDNIYCSLDSPFWGDRYNFNITASVLEDKNKAEIRLKGNYHPAAPEEPVCESMLNVSAGLKGTDLKHYNPYLKKYSPVREMAGRLDAQTEYSGKFSSFKSKGIAEIKDALIIYPQVFHSNLQPGVIHVEYDLSHDIDNLKLDVARLKVDNFEASGNLLMKAMDKEDPLLEARVVSSFFSLKEVRSYIPWKIIHKGVGEFIQQHIKDGNLRLIEGTLKGKLSQIKDINKKENAAVLHIRAEVDKGIFDVLAGAPVLHDICGIMELKNRQFSLQKMKAYFGSSPCTLEGRISDFALSEPAVYTAEMKIQPERQEILWLLGKEKFNKLSFKGPSLLHLSGKGTADDYHINARWDLTRAAYVYPDVWEKPASRQNTFTAEIVLNEEAVNFSSFNYDLPPAGINGSAMFKFSGDIPVDVRITSRDIDIQEMAPILPVVRILHPTGNCSLNLTGKGILNDPGSLQWKGNLSLTNVSLKPPYAFKTIRGLTGKAIFSGKTMHTSRMQARVGSSKIQGSFRIDDFRNPRLICQFDSNRLRAADFGWRSPEGDMNFNHVEGEIAIENENIHVSNLSFGAGESIFNLSGDINYNAGPAVSMKLISPYINTKDLAHMMTLNYQKQTADSLPGINVKAELVVDAGKFFDIDFKQLDTELKYKSDIIEVEKLEADFFDGKILAKGKADIQSDGQNHYEAVIEIDKISLEKIQRYLEMGERMVTGKLSLKGDVKTTGAGYDDFKKNLEGTVKLRTEKGVLKKFSVLSKIFSILNIYQLFKLQLPDMARDGMPYNHITAHLSMKDGVVSSEDFFMDSDAIKISGAGKIDYLHEKLDYVAGVHPLQTLDRITAVIPIAGWLITDEKGNLITVPFKVDGNWDDPRISPMPAKSIKKGMLDMLNRFLQLPAKLITDTGEVLLGR